MHKRKEEDKEKKRGTLTCPHIGGYWAWFWAQLFWAMTLSPTIVSPNTPQLCGDIILLPSLPDLEIPNMFDIYDSMSGCVCWKSCSSQWERADLEASAVLCSIFVTVFLFFSAKHNTSQDGQLRMLIFLHIGFSTGVQFNHVSNCEISCLWNQHFGIITTNGECVVPCSGQIVSPVLSWD